MSKSRQQEHPKVQRLRRIIFGGFGVLLVVVGAIGVYSIFSPVPSELDEGRHYQVLPGAEAPRQGPIVVTEYFSYGCVHCRNFEPQIVAWSSSLPEDVRFERVPVAFSSGWRALARAYYAAEELGILERNHQRVFDAIHVSGLTLATDESLAQLFNGNGTDAATFQRTMTSPAVRRKLETAEQRLRDDQVNAVPTLVVDGRYKITTGELSRRQILAVADRLIEEERAARSTTDAG